MSPRYAILPWIFILSMILRRIDTYNRYTTDDLLKYREEVREMFNHAYSGYLKHAYPYDELRPLTCDGVDTWGSYSLTLIDALDTLIVMGNYTEFERVVNIITETINFDINMNVSVFETNIRVIGGLLSAHILSHKAGIQLEPGWPCNGPLLRLAENVANRLLPAFDTVTGMPYGTVNLKKGVPPGETTITCTAGIGTFILEFGTLSRLTGDPIYEEVAMNALRSLFQHQSKIGLLGNHVDIVSGVWTSQDSGIGAGIDSYFEYLVKGALLFNKPELMSMFLVLQKSVNKYLKHDDWYFWVSMQKGLITLPLFQSLEAYWPGVLSHIGNVNESMKSIHNYHNVWKKYGFTPEFFNIIQQEVSVNRESYPLRPELIESVMYLYRATGNPYLLDIGVDILKSIQHSAVTSCGYATIKDCRDHSLSNRMESFFLAETTKYLYLLFDPDNFIHNRGEHGKVFKTAKGKSCIIDTGGYIFNTEAHPIDPSIFQCCTPEKSYYINQDTGQPDRKSKRLKSFQQNINEIGANLQNLSGRIKRRRKPDTSSSSNDLLKQELDRKIFEQLNDLYEHLNSKSSTTTSSAPSATTYSTEKPAKREFGLTNKRDKCTLKDLLEYLFIHVEDQCYLQDDQREMINNIKKKIASLEAEIETFKEYLENKTETLKSDYDPQSMLERIVKENKNKEFRLFSDLKLLYCKPQEFIQRFSFLGQFFGNP